MAGKGKLGVGAGLGAVLALPAGAHADNFTVQNTNDSGTGSLRDAIAKAKAQGGTDNRILFSSNVSGTINLVTPLSITDPLEIAGPGPAKVTVSGGGAIQIFDVAMSTPGSALTISGLTIAHGSRPSGEGAVIEDNSTLVLDHVVVTDNSSRTSNIDHSGAGPMTIRNSTISGNTATEACCAGFYTFSDTLIDGSTFANNKAPGGGEGAGYAYLAPTELLTVRDSTIASNSGGPGPGAGGFGVGNGGGSSGGGVLQNSILADNTASTNPDLFGPWQASFSLIESTTGATLTGSPNIIGQDPQLSPLANNGGPTETMALGPNSPALDKGSTTGTASDQRGAPRPFNLPGKPAAA